ncbi:MAG: Ig-like domain-containing protein, partial [Endomicrobia bacterium]|nr:Ig-like domain-containing protein [Endomicrobiia bacterium]
MQNKKFYCKYILLSLLFLSNILFSATRIKTVEYTFGIGPSTGVSSGVIYTYPTIRFRLPDAILIRRAWLELDAFVEGTGNNSNITSVQIYFSSGTSAGTTPRDDIADSGTVIDGSPDESIRCFFRADVTSVIGLPKTYTNYTAAVSITCATGGLIQNLALKLYITYEYEDKAAIQVQTVRFPLLSGANVASRLTQAAAGTITAFTYNAQVAEATYSGYTLQQQWFEIRGHRMSGGTSTDGSISAWISGNVALSTMTLDGSQIDSYDFHYIVSTGAVRVPGFLENTSQTLNVLNSNNAIYVLGGEVVLTYEFSIDAPVKTKTIRYLLGQGWTAGVNTPTLFEIPLFIEETLVSTAPFKAFYAEVHTSYNGTTEGSVSFAYSVKNVSGSVQTYYLNTQASQVSGHRFYLDFMSMDPNSNYSYGAPLRLQYTPGTNFANLGSIGAEVVITYHYTSAAKFTEYFEIMTGQARTEVTPSTGFPTAVWFPDPEVPTGRKVKRSFYSLIEFVQSNAANTTTANPSTTQNISGISPQTAPHRSTTENFYNTMVSTSAQVTLDTSSTSFVHNMSISVNKAIFTGKAFLTYSYSPAPSTPTVLTQYRANGVTVIPTGGWTNGTTVQLRFNMFSVIADTLTPVAEVKPLSQAFNGANLSTGTPVVYSGSGVVVGTITVSGLTNGTTYHWRARVVSPNGSSLWVSYGNNLETEVDFGCDLSSPVVSLVSPPNGTFTNQMNITFSWSGTDYPSGTNSGIKNYTLQISTDISFGVIYYSSTTSNTYLLTTLPQSTYYWRVSAEDNAGNVSSWSSVWNIIIDTTPPPAVNNLISPLNNSATNTTLINFSWQGVTDTISGIKNYVLQLSTVSDFSIINYTSTTVLTNATLTVLQGSYTWRVNVEDFAGNYTTSTIKYTLVIDTTPPSTPVLYNPLNNTATNYMNIKFEWSASDDSGWRGNSGIKGYELYISTKSDFSIFTSSSFVVSAEVSQVLSENIYYWRVRSVDNAGNYSAYTVSYTIVVDTTPPPEVYNLTVPQNNTFANYTDINFSWQGVTDTPSGVKNYILQISTSYNFTVINYSSKTSLSNATLSIEEGSYTWRVNVEDFAGNYTTSTVKYTLVVDTTPPQAVSILTSPVDNFATKSLTLNFSWQPVSDSLSGIKNYILQISTSYNFSVINYTTATMLTTVIMTISQGSYTWRVNTQDYALNYTTSQVRYNLIVDTTPPPQVTILSSPTNGFSTNYMTIYFSWEPVNDFPAGLKNYILQISTINNFNVITYSSTTISNFALFDLPQGSYTWRVNVEDKVLNYTTSTVSYTLLIDTTPPSVPLLTNPVNGFSTNYPVISFTWSISDDIGWRGGSGVKGYEVYISTLSDFSLIISSQFCNTNQVVMSLPEGVYWWRVRAVDNVGNFSPYSSHSMITIDTTPPRIVDNQTGDDTWQNVGGKLYNVDFFDDGYAQVGLYSIQYAISTSPYLTPPLLVTWTDIISPPVNQKYYTEDWSISFGLLLEEVTNYVSVRAVDLVGNTTIWHDVFYVKKDVTPPLIIDEQPGDDVWRKEAKSDGYNVDFKDTGGSLLNYAQYRIVKYLENGATQYLSSWQNIADFINTTYYYTNWQVDFDLLSEGINYIWVRVFDNAGNFKLQYDVFYVKKDTTPPTCFDYQDGDDVWRVTNNGSYNIDFVDTPSGSGIKEFQIKIMAESGSTIVDWSTVLTTHTYNYQENWQIPSFIWDNIQSGPQRNYVSVRSIDFAYNTSTVLSDAFYVLKDTVSPVIIDNQNGDDIWRRFGGTTYDVDFEDYESLLNKAEYIVRSGPNYTDPEWQHGWVQIFSSTGVQKYTTNWGVNFTNLTEGVNYIFVRAKDVAGNTNETSEYVFYIKKDISPPSIVNYQTGDYTWRNTSGTLYNVFFQDTISGVTTAQYRIIGPTGDEIVSWTNIFGGTVSYTNYNSSWAISEFAFNQLLEGTTNYVYVRCNDYAGNSFSLTTPAFFILKDTTSPYCEVKRDEYIRVNYLNNIDVDFFDPPVLGRQPGCSKLASAKYKIHSSTQQTGELVKNWTDIPEFIPGTTYFVDNWSIDFNVIKDTGVWYYVSVEIKDFAGNTTTYIDAFKVKKIETNIKITSNEEGDFVWYNSSTTFLQKYYDVDFEAENQISTISVVVYNKPQGNGDVVVSETIILNPNNNSYTQNWQLKPSTFTNDSYIWDLLVDGTNYVCVIVYCIDESSATMYDVFFVRKDTTPPAHTFLLYPLNNSAINQLVVNFSWQPVSDLTSGTSEYILQISTNTDFDVIYISSLTKLNFTLCDLQSESTYYWRVRVRDNAGNLSNFSSIYKVWVDTTPPTPAIILTPSSGTISNLLSQTFVWNPSYDNFSGILNYTLQVSTSLSFIPVSFSSVTLNTFASLSLRQGFYFWRVRTIDKAGNITLSTQTFTLHIDTTAPSIPTLVSPNMNFTTNYAIITFLWNISDDSGWRGNSGVKGYEFYISTTTDFSVYTSSQFCLTNYLSLSLTEGVHHWRVRAIDNAGNISSYSSYFTLIIDTSPPVIIDNQQGDDQWRNSAVSYDVDFEDKLSKLNTIQYCIYSSTDQSGSPIKDWTTIVSNLNSPSFTTNWEVDFLTLPEDTTCYVSVRCWDNLLQYSTSYNVFYVLKDITKPSIIDNQPGDDIWRKTNNGLYNINFVDTGGAKLQKFETKVMSGPLNSGTTIQGWILNDEVNIFGTTHYAQPWKLKDTTWNLLPEGKSYVSVRVFDNSYSPSLGYNMDTLVDAFYVLKDTTPPDIVDNQPGDTQWRNSNYTFYDVDFKDSSSGSGIKEVQVKVSTGSEIDIANWTTIITTNTYNYTQNWQLQESIWKNLLCEVTNYISVRVFDFANNVSTLTNVFFVLKDTIPPRIENLQAGDNVWRKQNNGVYKVYFYDDGGSKLNKFQLCVSTKGYNVEPLILNWTDSEVLIYGTTFYVNDWQLPQNIWELLHSGTNYISIRVTDNAYSTTTLTNGFYILKDTQQPTGLAVTPAYSSTNTFNVTYQAVDYGFSGIQYVKLYYTLQTQAPYTWLHYITTTSLIISFTAAQEGNYGFKVVVYDNAGNTDELDPPLATIPPEATTLVTFSAPIISDQQEGDDIWRNSPKADGYAVYFYDYVSGLDSAEYIIRAGPNPTDEVIKEWTYIFKSTNVNSYTQKWHIDFDLCKASWNYISVRVWNLAGLTTTVNNVFYVKKDTQAPIVSYNEFSSGGDDVWRNNFKPSGYDVDFYDGLSYLSKAEYYVGTSSDINTAQTIINWQTIASGISSPTYNTNWQVDFNSLAEYTTNYVFVRLSDIAGNLATYYAFYILKDTTPPYFVNKELGGDLNWRKIQRFYDIDLFDTISAGRTDKLYKLEYSVWSLPNLSGTNLISWTTPHTNAIDIKTTYYVTDWAVNFDLLQNGTNYVSVRGFDLAGNTTMFVDAFRILKDVQPPTVEDNQSGDDIWRGINEAVYDIDFIDLHSGCTSFETIVFSNPNMGGNLIDNWRLIMSTKTTEFRENWKLKDETFNNMNEGLNYVSVRVYDNVGNVSISTDVFYVKKDTTQPTISDYEPDDENWYNSGRAYNVDFYDGLSQLNSAEYTVFTQEGQSGTQVLPWTQIFSNLYSTSYTSDWNINFGALVQGYNFVSVRVKDFANNTTTYVDVFYVKKDTVVPSQITGLASTTGINEGEINLSWVAPFDPQPGSGVSQYIVKFATIPINQYNFDTDPNVKTYVQGWIPKTPGSIETKTLTGLSQNRNYYVAIKSIDAAGNISILSSTGPTKAKEDTTPPANITTLSAQAGPYSGQITLSWQAPGDNGLQGNLFGTYIEGDEYSGYYKIRYWKKVSTPTGWNDNIGYIGEVDGPLPVEVGYIQTFTFSGLEIGSTYWFMIGVWDKAGNFSTSTFVSSFPVPPGPANGNIMWATTVAPTNQPRTRRYLAPLWEGSFSTGPVASATIRWVRLVSCPTFRNEKIAGILAGNAAASSGRLYLQRYDGVNNQWADMLGQVNSTLIDDRYRAFDLAYENNSGRCIVVYYNGTAGQIQYRVWSSTSQSWVIGPTNFILSGITGAIYWVRLEPRP